MSSSSRLGFFLTPKRRQELAREVEEEFRAHISDRLRDNVREGQSPELAELSALSQFGDMDKLARECLREIENQPIRVVIRMTGATATLAVVFFAIALSFAVVYSSLLRPLRFEDSESLVAGRESSPTMSVASYQLWRDNSDSFESLTMYNASRHLRTDLASPTPIRSMMIDTKYFDVLKIKPILGKTFSPDDFAEGAPEKVLISEYVWVESFRRQASVLGKVIELDGLPYEISGVMPSAAQLTHAVDVWTALRVDAEPATRQHYVVGRLRSSVSFEQAQKELSLLTRSPRFASENFPLPNPIIYPLKNIYRNEVREKVLFMFGLSLALLILAWAVRFQQRASRAFEGELQRKRLEDVAVPVVATAVATVATMLVFNPVLSALGGRWATVMDSSVLYPIIGICLVMGVGPVAWNGFLRIRIRALLSRRRIAFRVEKSRPGARVWQNLVASGAGSIAIALTLVVVTAAVQSGWPLRIQAFQSKGYQEENLFSGQLSPTANGADTRDLFSRALQSIRQIPQVESASLSRSFPLQTERWILSNFERRGDPLAEKDDKTFRSSAYVELVDSDYFSTMQTSIVHGRPLDIEDISMLKTVAVVNESFASRFFPASDPVGREIDVDCNGHFRTIVGVAENVVYQGSGKPVDPIIYLPNAVMGAYSSVLVVRSDENTAALERLIRKNVTSIAPALVLHDFDSASNARTTAMHSEIVMMTWLGLVAAMAVLLTILTVTGSVREHVRRHLLQIAQNRTKGKGGFSVFLFSWRPAIISVGLGVTLGAIGVLFLPSMIPASFLPTFDGIPIARIVITVTFLILFVSVIPAKQALLIAPG